MKSIKALIVITITVLSLMSPSNAWSHGLHFSDAEDVADHIQAHLVSLEAYRQNPVMNRDRLADELQQIEAHSLQYEQAIRATAGTRAASGIAGIGQRLGEASRTGDVTQVYTLLKVMDSFLLAR